MPPGRESRPPPPGVAVAPGAQREMTTMHEDIVQAALVAEIFRFLRWMAVVTLVLIIITSGEPDIIDGLVSRLIGGG